MSDWFKEWFASEEYLDVYGHRNIGEAEKFIKFINSKIEIEKGNLVLDAACGAGRHSFVLSKLGYKTIAFDLSKTLLKQAKLSPLNDDSILFLNADLRYIHFKPEFSAVFNLFTSFGYFDTDAENFRFPRNAFGFLKPKGYYIFDYLNAEFVKNNLVNKSTRTIGDKVVLETREIAGDRVVKRIEIKSKNNVQNYLESVKLYSPNTLLNEFGKIGYKVEKIFGNYQGSDFNDNKSERFIAIFRK